MSRQKFESLMNDRVSFLKADGRKIRENIKAAVNTAKNQIGAASLACSRHRRATDRSNVHAHGRRALLIHLDIAMGRTLCVIHPQYVRPRTNMTK